MMVTPGKAGIRGWGKLATNWETKAASSAVSEPPNGHVGQNGRIGQRIGGKAGVNVGHDSGDRPPLQAAIAAVPVASVLVV